MTFTPVQEIDALISTGVPFSGLGGVVADNTLVAHILLNGAGSATFTFSDPGNTWTQAAFSDLTGFSTASWYCEHATAGTHTITVVTSSGDDYIVQYQEWAGALQFVPGSGSAAGNNSGSTSIVVPFTVQTGDVATATVNDNVLTVGPVSPWVNYNQGSNFIWSNGADTAYANVASTGTLNVTWTSSGSGNWDAAGLVLRAGGAADTSKFFF
jgi:hypothetical protein